MSGVAEKYWLVHSKNSHQVRCKSHAELKREVRNLLRKSPITGEYFTNEAYVTQVTVCLDVTRVPILELDLIDELWDDE